ncbi:MAG: hypothetical protein IKW92_00790 [Firmicutes bacterium]|nr:hypothetical protein [Bacillota bacterium]
MERIIVSEAFRIAKTNCSFNLKFNAEVDLNKAYEAMEVAINEITKGEGYKDLWLQDLRDCCDKDEFNINSTLESDEFANYIPAMCEAVAKAMPEIEFEGTAYYDELRGYYIDDFEFSFYDGTLTIKETVADDDCGYFCPECGERVAYFDEELIDDEIECEDCEETIKVCDLKKVEAYTSRKEIKIR